MCQLAVFCQPLEHCKAPVNALDDVCLRPTRQSLTKVITLSAQQQGCQLPTGDTNSRRRRQAHDKHDWMPPSCIVACHKVGLLHARTLSASVSEAPRATSKICCVVTQVISKQHCLRLLVLVAHNFPHSDLPCYPHRNSAGYGLCQSCQNLDVQSGACLGCHRTHASLRGNAPQQHCQSLPSMSESAPICSARAPATLM